MRWAAIAGVTAMSGWLLHQRRKLQVSSSTILPSRAGIYYWQRRRDRKDVAEDKYQKPTFLTPHGTPTLDFQSGYTADMFNWISLHSPRLKMAENGDSGHPNEIAFSSSNKVYDEDWSGDKSGISLYKGRSKI